MRINTNAFDEVDQKRKVSSQMQLALFNDVYSAWLNNAVKMAIIICLMGDFIPPLYKSLSGRWDRKVERTRRESMEGKRPLIALLEEEIPGEREEWDQQMMLSRITGYNDSAALRYWGNTTYEMSWRISLHVFAWRREKSLRRLCNSLLRANYFGHEVPIYFHIDGEPLKLVVDYVKQFQWPYGPKVVNVRPERVHMPSAILSGWTPTSDDEYAILLEDDVEVAASFFEFSLYCLSLMTYKRITEGEKHGLLGCSLYTPRVDEIGPAPNPGAPPAWNPSYVIGPRHRLFYFQLPCSWGALYSAKHWREFLLYYSIRTPLGPNFLQTPNSRSNEWFSSWKRILIELMLFRGWYMLYPSFPNQVSFSTNYFEKGIHSVSEGQQPTVPNEIRKFGDRRFTVPLMSDNSFRASLPIPSAGLVRKIPYVNLYHQRVLGRRQLRLDARSFLKNVTSAELYRFFEIEPEVKPAQG